MKNRDAFVHAQDEHLDIMIALAFDLDDAEAVQQLSETDDPPLTTDDESRADVLLSSAFSKAEQQQRQTRANGFRAVLRKVLPAALRAAACLLLILTVSFSVAFATSAVFRSKVLTLVVSVDEEQDWIFHVDFLEDLDSAFDVPQDWTGLYFPSALPDGYVISMTDSTPPRIIYQNPLGQNFCYAEYDEADSVTVSTENATTRFINIGGIVAHLVESESSDGSAHVTTITWTNDHRWFSLTGENMTLDTLIKIAASVKKIIH